MYDTRPGLIIGFPGCDISQQESLLKKSTIIPISTKPYDWLGHGMYFWENNYDRALQWANEKKAKGKIEQPAVIGAVLDLAYCCDLLDSRFTSLSSQYWRLMKVEYAAMGKSLPVNKDANDDPNKDKLIRFRDCAVFEFMHEYIRDAIKGDSTIRGYSKYKLFDSVRGVFPEGEPAYEGAGFFAKSHIQICIRNPNCIKGFFLKREEIDFVLQETGYKPIV